MSVADDIRLASTVDQLPLNSPAAHRGWTSSDGRHRVIHNDVFNITLPEKADVFFFDPPGLPENCPFSECEMWMKRLTAWVGNNAKLDSGVIIVPRDRKGHPYQKSVVLAYQFQAKHWEVFRQFTWLNGEGDFHRSRYSAAPVWALRRGSRPAQQAAPSRYLDVIRVKDDFTSHGMLQSLPIDLIRQLLPLFAKPGDLVCDPFAGGGGAMTVAKEIKARSVSIELNPERAQALKEML